MPMTAVKRFFQTACRKRPNKADWHFFKPSPGRGSAPTGGVFNEIIQKFDSVPHTALNRISHSDKSMLILMTFGDWEHEHQCQKRATLARFGIHEAQAKTYMHEGPLQVLAANQVRNKMLMRGFWDHGRG